MYFGPIADGPPPGYLSRSSVKPMLRLMRLQIPYSTRLTFTVMSLQNASVYFFDYNHIGSENRTELQSIRPAFVIAK